MMLALDKIEEVLEVVVVFFGHPLNWCLGHACLSFFSIGALGVCRSLPYTCITPAFIAVLDHQGLGPHVPKSQSTHQKIVLFLQCFLLRLVRQLCFTAVLFWLHARIWLSRRQ